MSKAPLEGIRVADFCWAWAGPYGALQLAHLGAEVIRIESATRPCPSRHIPPWAENERGENRAGYFNQYNQGKRSLTLNLKKPEGIALAKQLVAKSDIVTENFAANIMDKMGLGYQVLRAIKPDIIMISLSGYGATGPEKSYVSYGPPQVALSGMSSLTGYQGGPPLQAGFSYGDPNGGVHGTFAIMCALLHRAKTGEGQYIDLSQREACAMLLPEALMDYAMNGTQPPRMGNRDSYMAPHGVFRCRGEDRWVSIVVRNDEEWRRMCTVMGYAELAIDPRFTVLAARKENEDALEQIVTEWTQERSADEVTQSLQQAGIAAYPSLDGRDMLANPHITARGFFVELEHPEVGKRRHLGIPWKMSRTPCEVRRPAPCLGQDTDYVLGDILGLSREEISSLRAKEVLI
ncbi:MAG TPA: CoA transferase [Candidatus Binatia bacterium]|jgi:benzylsuccinate CoA-transferase BbsF subunit|nr:CoA transferase [Candidatus Binatia bacterium]